MADAPTSPAAAIEPQLFTNNRHGCDIVLSVVQRKIADFVTDIICVYNTQNHGGNGFAEITECFWHTKEQLLRLVVFIPKETNNPI
jgi:hypothetical protein